MKRLLILRHAKAERESDSGNDFDRALDERGWKDALEVGRVMRERGLDPDVVIASPAKRVVETLAALAEGYGPLDAGYDQRIYNASLKTLLEVVGQADDDVRTVLLVGHNPGLQLLLLKLSGGQTGENFPTAALAAVDLDLASWADIDRARDAPVDLILR